ncbi:MAG TPA: hypothetical protein VLA09_05220 [Longimicrobiales bacterium]|nr:hypothetical protein [Longimicrobiales bacterium]
MRMPRVSLVATLSIAVVSLGCSETPLAAPVDVEPSLMKGGGGRGGGPDGGETVASITIDDAAAHNVASDDGTPYVDGEALVALTFGDADFVFEPASRKRGNRSLSISFADPLGGATSPFDEDPTTLGHPGSFRVLADLTAMPCDGTASAVPARFFWGPDNNGPLYRLSLGVDGTGDAISISRTDNGDGTSEWEMISSGAGHLTETSQNDDFDSFGMPFRFVLTGSADGCS